MIKNVLHINTHDSGGAAMAAYRLHKKFKTDGFNSCIAVKYKTRTDPDIIQIKPGIIFRLKKKLGRLVIKKKNIKTVKDYHFLNLDEKEGYFPTKEFLNQLPIRPDLIIVYWVSGFINAKNFYELAQLTKAPILWYFLDMEPFTGGCHYFWDCDKFLSHCRACPALNPLEEKDFSWKNFSLKARYLAKTNVHLLLGTSELVRYANLSPLFTDKSKLYLPLGINLDLFCPSQKRHKLKIKYGIPEDVRVLLIVCDSIEKRKGVDVAIECLKKLKDTIESAKNCFVLIVGRKGGDVIHDIPFPCHSLNFLNEEELPIAYQMADGFLCSSLEDAGPMMVMEALACGVPVIGFDIGIIPDIIIEGKTGYIAKKGNVLQLTNGVRKLLNLSHDDLRNMSDNCQNMANNTFSLNLQMTRLIEFVSTLKNGRVNN